MVSRSISFTQNRWQRTETTDTRKPGVVTLGNLYNIWTKYGDNVQTGVENPNWRHQVARGQDATTAYTRSWYRGRPATLTALTHTVENWPYGYTISSYDTVHETTGWNHINTIDDVALRDRALARLKSRLQDNIGNFDSVVPAVELRELRGLVRGSAELTTSFLQSLIDIRRTRGRSAAQWASQAWLTYGFGIRPLISDTQKAAEAVASFMERSDRSIRLRGSASKQWVTSANLTGTGGHNCPFYLNASIRHTLSYRYTAGLRLDLKSGNNYGVTDHFGLELSALPSIGWELVPYSWVVDYFTTVGSYLGDTFVLPPGSTKYLTLSKLYKMEGVLRGTHRSVYVNSHVLHTSCRPGFIEYTRLDRSKLSALPRASLRFRTVDEIGSNAVNRLLNLASVLVSGRSVRF